MTVRVELYVMADNQNTYIYYSCCEVSVDRFFYVYMEDRYDKRKEIIDRCINSLLDDNSTALAGVIDYYFVVVLGSGSRVWDKEIDEI